MKKKRKSVYSNIVLEDTYFKLGAERVVGHILAQNGIPYFYCDEKGTASSLPFAVSSDYLGVETRAYMRNGTTEILAELGEDDVLIDELEDDELDVLAGLEPVNALYEEEKIRRLSDLTYPFFVCIFSVAAVITGIVMKKWFILVAGLIALAINVFDIYRISKVFRRQRVYDAAGHYVDLSTGETDLNGGYKIPSESEAGLF